MLPVKMFQPRSGTGENLQTEVVVRPLSASSGFWEINMETFYNKTRLGGSVVDIDLSSDIPPATPASRNAMIE